MGNVRGEFSLQHTALCRYHGLAQEDQEVGGQGPTSPRSRSTWLELNVDITVDLLQIKLENTSKPDVVMEQPVRQSLQS